MRKEINASREVILAASRELEQKVATRTAELSVRNEELLALNELAGSLTRSLDPEAILAARWRPSGPSSPTTGGHGYRLGRDGSPGRRAGRSPRRAAPPSRRSPPRRSRPTSWSPARTVMASSSGCRWAPAPVRWARSGCAPRIAPGAEMTALLMAIGNQVGLALSTARLSDEGREMAVLEERTRLAREIHDTLAQQLTGIVIQLEAAQALVSRDPERSMPALASAQELARSALAEARRSVWDLRPAPADRRPG